MRRICTDLPAVILVWGLPVGLAVAFWVSMAFGSTPEHSAHAYWSVAWSPASDPFADIFIDAFVLVLTMLTAIFVSVIGGLLTLFASALLIAYAVASISSSAAWFVGIVLFAGAAYATWRTCRWAYRRLRKSR